MLSRVAKARNIFSCIHGTFCSQLQILLNISPQENRVPNCGLVSDFVSSGWPWLFSKNFLDMRCMEVKVSKTTQPPMMPHSCDSSELLLQQIIILMMRPECERQSLSLSRKTALNYEIKSDCSDCRNNADTLSFS